MKYILREHFSIEMDGEVIVGPCEIELSEEKAELEKHKLDEVPKKKSKKPEDE
jgi:hypothetical protein